MKWACILLIAVAGCNKPEGSKPKADPPPKKEEPAKKEEPKVTGPERLEIQLIIIGFKEVPAKKGDSITRTQEEARTMASGAFERAQKGEDFDALVHEFTDGEYPGVLPIANSRVKPIGQEVSRDQMQPIMGDLIFGMRVGETARLEYDGKKWPGPFVIVKRQK